MRLALPRINSLQSEDGTASITFQEVNMDRDSGGLDYLFKPRMPSGEVEIRTTVAIVTSTPASQKFHEESGNDLYGLKMEEIQKYVENFAAEHGNIFEVRIFAVPSGTSDSSIVALRDAFCDLFLKYWSSYKYNNSDGAGDPADSYPDMINFLPFGLNRKFYVTRYARQGRRHG